MVYEHRAAVCRAFDCRILAAMGLRAPGRYSSAPGLGVRRPRASPAPAAETKCTRKTAAWGCPTPYLLGVGKSPARFSARLPGAAFKRALQARHPSPATPRVVLYG